MKKIRRSPVVTGLLFLLAVVLLFAGTVGGTQAALQVYSTDYLSAFDLDHIGVTLFENDKAVAYRNYGDDAAAGFTESQDGDLVLNTLGDDEHFQIGKDYDFVITARNTGTIDQYVRVIIYKYWVHPETPTGPKEWFHGDNSTKIKDDSYDPALIHPSYLGSDYNTANWIRDEDSRTPERDIYYYRGMLSPVNGNTTEPLFTDLAVSADVTKNVTKTVTGNKVVYTYAYDGLGFVIKAEVEAVQTHNAEKAIRSAWGLTNTGIMNAMGITTSNPNG